MEDEALDRAPIWDDLATFPGEQYRGKVDIVSAGFPCQPWSVAGKRLGIRDPRWLWPHIARIVREVEPGLVFLENVPGLAHGADDLDDDKQPTGWRFPAGLWFVLGELAGIGWNAEWISCEAAAVGAPQERERIFVLAWAPGPRTRRAAAGMGMLPTRC